jgi:flagellar motor switch protein FliM
MERYDFAAAADSRTPGTPGMERDLERAAPRVGLLLEAMLRRPVVASAGTLTRVHASDAGGDNLTFFALEHGGAGHGVATAPAIFVTTLAELFMGGPGHPASRVPSPLECRVVGSRLASALGPAAEVLPVQHLRLIPSAEALTPAGEFVRWTFDLRAGEVAGTVALTLPARLFAAGDVRVGAGPLPEPDRDLVTALHAVPLPLTVRFGAVRLPGTDLEQLAVGDVVRLAHPIDEPLVAEVDGQPLFLARPGRRGRRLAVEIAELVGEENPR